MKRKNTNHEEPNSNKFLKNILALEKLFDLQDRFKRSMNVKKNNTITNHEIMNIVIEMDIKPVNLGYCLSNS